MEARIDGILKKSIPNPNPIYFENIGLYSGVNGYHPANAQIKNFLAKSENAGNI